jgi:phosphopantothenoylcysteine decarboxylase/phosphopantothenate--cysteine ligase
MLFRKKIILGVTGSIAAYKSALLTRLLVKAGAEVRVVMTDSARSFITPLTLHTLSKNKVNTSFTIGEHGEWVNHVELGLWADAMIIAPSSANTLAHCANGVCESLLVAVYLSARCPVFFAPAMDVDMWNHPSTKNNIQKLKSFGNHIIEPGSGELASGLVGEGRMSEPHDIVNHVEDYYAFNRLMKNKKVLLTAGPTREPIDSVRYISNYSSGKMGYAIANELAERGADVTLVSGPVSDLYVHPKICVVKVVTAEEMHQECLNFFPTVDAAILCAAVADYKPREKFEGKLKKNAEELKLELSKTTDILSTLGTLKNENQILVGFALETSDGRINAEKKIKEKNLDFIVLNMLSQENHVFGSDSNHVEIGISDGRWISFEPKSKNEIAVDIVNQLVEQMNHE